VAVHRVLAEWRQLIGQFGPPIPRERRCDADVIEVTGVVVQPEQQRPDVGARPVLVPAEAGDDAVGRALVLDLEHRPLAGLVGRVESFRDDAVEPGALEPVEPVGGRRAVAGRRRQVDRRLDAEERLLQPRAPLVLRHLAQILVAECQQVPRHEARRRLGGEHVDPRRGRVDAQQQRLEVERAVAGDDHLAVDDAALRQRGLERLGQLGKVAIERLEVARLREHLVAVAEHDRPEAVPLGLEQPAVGVGQGIDRLGEHGFDRGRDGQVDRHGPRV
jgi:hypothetical protein